MYSGVTLRTIFEGTAAYILLKDDSARNRFNVTIDSTEHILETVKGDTLYLLADSLKNTVHFLEITRITEWHGGNTVFLGLKIIGKGVLPVPPMERKIEFIGNSITCGYGSEGKSRQEHFSYQTENCLHTYAAYTAKNLHADFIMVCRSGIGMYQSYGGDTAFAMPLLYPEVVTGSPVKWEFSRFVPDVVVIELCANDLSSKVDSVKFTRAYVGFLKVLRGHYLKSKIVCLSGPGGFDDESNNQRWINLVKGSVSEASKNLENISYYGMEPTGHSGSDWHPNAEEHKQLSRGLTSYLRTLMDWK